MQREFEANLREMQDLVSAEELQRMRQNFDQFLASTEETLRAMAGTRPLGDSLRSSALHTTQQELDRLQAILQGLDASGRAAPACLDLEQPLELGTCTDMNRLVRANPRYFDAAASRGAIQLLVVRAPLHVAEDPRHTELRTRMLDLLDRTGLQALLAQ